MTAAVELDEVAAELESEVVVLTADEDEDVDGGSSAREGAWYEFVADVARLVDAAVDAFIEEVETE